MVKAVKIMIILVAAFLLYLVVSDYITDYKALYNEELTSTSSHDGEEVIVEIPEGSSVKEVAKILHKNELIRFERAFVKRLKNSQYRGKLRAGTFTLHKGMNTLEMMEIMSEEDPDSKVIAQLVIPEGYTVDLIAAKCEKEGICEKNEFINAVKSITANDFKYLEDVPSGADVRYKLEGYLFPATYDITKTTTAKDIVNMMLNAFNAYYTDEMNFQASEKGYTSYQVITLASMIEREARIDSERPKIASVLENRLREDMLLQIDSTVLYPISYGMYDIGDPTVENLSIDSPYNTYAYLGLPVGPICNPGLACINAVLNPDETNYLYYHVIDKEKGEHVFTETYEEHQATMIGGTDTDGDGIPDIELGAGYEQNNVEDDIWSNEGD
ncbi:MAG: endolytic transglycosylase MltG [Eubacterium sp.]|nr:endolytic transglycosylase MltG [Eubacterium sp.]